MDNYLVKDKSTTENMLSTGADFIDGLGHGLSAPVRSVNQLVDEAYGRGSIDAKHTAAPADQSTAQKFGEVIGEAVPFVAAALLTRRFIPAAAGSRLASAAFGFGFGAGYDFLFHPVSNPGDNFWASKLHNGVVSGLTVGAMSGLAPAGYGGEGLTRWQSIRNGTFTGFKTGVFGGLVNAEADSLLSGQGPASKEHLINSALSFGLVGGTLGGIGGAFAKLEAPTSERSVSSTYLAREAKERPMSENKAPQDEVPWFRRTKPNGDPEPSIARGEDGSVVILDNGVAYSFKNGKWTEGLQFSHEQMAEFSPVRSQADVYRLLGEAEKSLGKPLTEDPTKSSR